MKRATPLFLRVSRLIARGICISGPDHGTSTRGVARASPSEKLPSLNLATTPLRLATISALVVYQVKSVVRLVGLNGFSNGRDPSCRSIAGSSTVYRTCGKEKVNFTSIDHHLLNGKRLTLSAASLLTRPPGSLTGPGYARCTVAHTRSNQPQLSTP